MLALIIMDEAVVSKYEQAMKKMNRENDVKLNHEEFLPFLIDYYNDMNPAVTLIKNAGKKDSPKGNPNFEV